MKWPQIKAELARRGLNVATAFDQFLWVILTLGNGSPDETVSAALWRMETQGKLAGRLFRRPVDWTFFKLFGQRDHCMHAFIAEMRRAQLPSTYREERTGA